MALLSALMHSSFWFDSINTGWSIVLVFIEGSQIRIVFLSLKNGFVLANSVGPDEMPHYAAFHLCLHYLPNYSFSSH